MTTNRKRIPKAVSVVPAHSSLPQEPMVMHLTEYSAPKDRKLRTQAKFACLTYHAIGAGTSQYTLSEKQLLDQLALLKTEGYVVDGFEQLETRLRSDHAVSNRYVVVTVDDGRDNSMRAADAFEMYGCKATFFLIRDRSLKKPGYLRGSEIRELRKRGFSLGTHGTTHCKWTFMPHQACTDELRCSKKWLEDMIGEEVRYVAPPGGYINARIRQLIYQHGYVLTGTSNEWMNSPETMTLPGAVNRVGVRQFHTLHDLHRIIDGHLGFYIRRQLRAAAVWIPKQLLRERF